jgi:small subunit ribosomal protein S9
VAEDKAVYNGTGKRKTSVARVRLTPGQGTVTCNGRTIEDYFPRSSDRMLALSSLVLSGQNERFDVIVRLHGGGVTGQAGALRLAIARALIGLEPEDRPALKKAGFLTRDPRAKERKKYGLKKARKAPQYSKR